MCSHFPDLPYDEPRPGSGYAGALPVPAPPAPYEIAQRLAELRKNNRWKLWDVPEEYRCPIVGTCLHVEELRGIARQNKSNLDPRSSDYQIHVRFVAGAGERNSLSIAAQKLLDRKHAMAVRQFARAKDEEDLRRLWREAVAAGQVPGAFWALMTHPKANAGLRGQACQDVHMLSDQVAERPWRHIVGATTAAKEPIILRIVCINLIKCFKMLAVLAVVPSRVRSPSP